MIVYKYLYGFLTATVQNYRLPGYLGKMLSSGCVSSVVWLFVCLALLCLLLCVLCLYYWVLLYVYCVFAVFLEVYDEFYIVGAKEHLVV